MCISFDCVACLCDSLCLLYVSLRVVPSNQKELFTKVEFYFTTKQRMCADISESVLSY